MKRWGNNLMRGREQADAGNVETPEAKLRRQMDAGDRAKERAQREDEKRGTIFESKMKRKEKKR